MSSKSFRGFHGTKNRSASTAFISLHFNKADEDQLEINYGDKSGDSDASQQDPSREETVREISPEKENDLSNLEDTDSDVLKLSLEDDLDNYKDTRNRRESSRESTPSRDSVVKEYWSRISKRTNSLDSDVGLEKNQECHEGWMFFKDIKGKLVKTLEERKSKEQYEKILSKVDISTVESKEIGDNLAEANDTGSDHTVTDNYQEVTKNTKFLKLSPAVEAAEIINENTMFEHYVNDKLDKAKCEIITTEKVPSLDSQFSLLHPKKFLQKKSDSSMKLSSLTENKSINIDSEIKNTSSAETSEFATSCSSSEANSNPNVGRSVTDVFHKWMLFIKNCRDFVKSSWNSAMFRILMAAFASLLMPVPSWLSGFIIGTVLSSYVMYWLFKPGRPKEPFCIPNYSQLPPLNIPVSEVEDEPIIYKGWMNELPYDLNYNPDTYHVNCTRSVYIRLDGTYLRFSYPQNNIPKRAMFNESRHDMQFIYQQHYDITGASVELLPKGLARKRLWSKKYPICLRISNPKQSVLSHFVRDNIEEAAASKSSRRESPIKKYIPRINENNEVVIYLFSRTDREKDLWYYRFKRASKMKMLKYHSPSSSPNIAAIDISTLENKRTISMDLASLQLHSDYDNLDSLSQENDNFIELSMTKQQKFEMYMSHLLAPLHIDHSLSFASLKKDKDISDSRASKHSSLSQNSLAWLNILLGRIFFDFLTEDVWAQCVAEKIQRKLSKIKLPAFLTELIVKDINLGTALPKIHRASEPSVDQKGLWIDIDLSYNGSFHMTLETKLNLLRYKSDSEDLSLSNVSKESETIEQPIRSPLYNSEEEDSAESSSDEDIPLPEIHDGSAAEECSQTTGGSTGKKILRFVDKLAQSTYFQHAAKNRYIKRAMEDISNTPLVLTVEVQWLTGTLAVNVPPMPTDRLWYGFRTNPFLSIVARPKLGQHVVTFTHVTDWIERKLVSEFQKILVMPNMDDLIIPIMQSDPDLPKV